MKKGVLRNGWTATLEDYAIVCEWGLNGNILLTGDIQGNMFGFDSKTGEVLWKKNNSHKNLLAMNIHPDGKTFVSAGQDGFISLNNTQNGKIIETIEIGQQWVEHVVWSPDGRWLGVTNAREVIVLNSSGKKQWRSNKHASTVSAISWSNINELAVACYGKVTIYDILAGNTQQQLEWKGSLISMVLSPDGDIVACGSQDNTVHFWRRSTGHDSMMRGYPGKPANLTFDSNGTLLATGGSETVTVWSFKDSGPEGTAPGELELHERPITCLSFAPKGTRLASGSKDGSIAVWYLNDDGNGDVIGTAKMNAPISNITWRPDGRALAATNAIGEVTTWRINK